MSIQVHSYLIHQFIWTSFQTFTFWVLFSMVVLVSGIFGDLFESLLKRNFNLKDSGNKLPGHGGFLDRFDSFFFVIPYVYFYLKIMNLNNQEVVLDILNIAIDAGKEILKIYKKNFNVDLKADNSPITEADINSNNLIKKRLIEIEKNIPILTEESLVNWDTRKVWKKYWLIDPLDGTKEFVNRNGEFTVNISLIENNLPIFGVIYAPEKSLLYYGLKNDIRLLKN